MSNNFKLVHVSNQRLEPREVRYGGAMFGQEEIDEVNAVISNPMGLIPGARVSEFESRVAEFMGKKHGVMVNSGSSALLIAMRLLNLPPGSEIISKNKETQLVTVVFNPSGTAKQNTELVRDAL